MDAVQPYRFVILFLLLVLAGGVICGRVWFVKRMNEMARGARESQVERRQGDHEGCPL